MAPPTNDPLLEHLAAQYADKVGITVDAARGIVDAMPAMQPLLGRTDMSYAEACRMAGIAVPDTAPEAHAIVVPEPAQVPAEEVEPAAFAAAPEAAAPEPVAVEPDLAEVVELRPAPETNTLLTLTYRARETTVRTTVLPGAPDQADIDRIYAGMIHGTWIVPEQVGLANPRRGDQTSRYDHPYVELTIDTTTAEPTRDGSLAELADGIESVVWQPATFTPYQEAAA